MRDHPRVCGEKCGPLRWGPEMPGSPPRMRGKETVDTVNALAAGITPAYAGKRCSPLPLGGRSQDHPRVCGEKKKIVLTRSIFTGSPPRMRGKGRWWPESVAANGITPAYAGKRLKRSHSIGHFSCILCLFHSVLHKASVSGGSRAGPCAPPCLPAQNTVPV